MFSVNYNVGSPITSTVLVTLNPVVQSNCAFSHPSPDRGVLVEFNGQIVVPPLVPVADEAL